MKSPANYGKVLEPLVIILVVVFMSYTREQHWSLLAPLIFGCAVLIFAYEGGSVSAWMQNKFIVSIGVWSYSIYLMHWPILLIINQYTPDLNNQIRLWLHSSNQHEFEFANLFFEISNRKPGSRFLFVIGDRMLTLDLSLDRAA